MPSPSLPRDNVTGVILAGGRGRRMGGLDKGLIALDGRPLAAHIAARLAPQVAGVLMNANRHAERYAALGYPLVPDRMGDFDGPLVGVASAMQAARTPLLATVPCDSPLLPLDLVQRLYAGLEQSGAEIALPHDGKRTQQVFALYRTALYPQLLAYLSGGGRQVRTWFAQRNCVEIDFSDCPAAFLNLNTPEDWQMLSPQLNAPASP